MWAFLGSLQSGRKGPVERCTSKNVNELKWCLLHRIAPKIARNSLIIWIIYFGVCLSSAQINSRNLLGMNYVNHLLNFLSWSIYLHLLLTINLFDHDPSHSPARSFFRLNTFMPQWAKWSIMIMPLIWVRSNYADVFWFTWPSLHYKYLAPSQFQRGVAFKNSDSHSYLRDYNVTTTTVKVVGIDSCLYCEQF